jgi:hypothetical protein
LDALEQNTLPPFSSRQARAEADFASSRPSVCAAPGKVLASIRTGPASPLTSALPQSGGDSRVHSRSPPVTLHSIKELYDAHVGRGPDLHVCCHGLRGDTLPLPVLFVLRCSRRHAPHLHDNPQCVTANGRLSKRGVSSRSWCLRYVPTWARRRPTLVFDAEDLSKKTAR